MSRTRSFSCGAKAIAGKNEEAACRTIQHQQSAFSLDGRMQWTKDEGSRLTIVTSKIFWGGAEWHIGLEDLETDFGPFKCLEGHTAIDQGLS